MKILKTGKKHIIFFFFDPPFKDLKFINNLIELKSQKIYEKNHLIIIHRERKDIEKFDEVFKTFFEKIYGRSKIIFGKF